MRLGYTQGVSILSRPNRNKGGGKDEMRIIEREREKRYSERGKRKSTAFPSSRMVVKYDRRRVRLLSRVFT